MGGDDHLLRRLGHIVRQTVLAGQVEAGKRLVEQQHARVGGLQGQPAHLLALALAQAADGAVGPVGQAALCQQLTRRGEGLRLLEATGAQRQGDFLFDDRVDDLIVRVLEHQADELGAFLGRGMNVHAADAHVAGLRRIEPAQQPQQTGLARAVVADQADALLGQMEIKTVKHLRLAALQGDLFDLHAGGVGIEVRVGQRSVHGSCRVTKKGRCASRLKERCHIAFLFYGAHMSRTHFEIAFN